MARKKTALQKEYTKELRNLKRRIETMSKGGVFIDKTSLLKTPKSITRKEVERLKSLRGEKLFKKGESFLGDETYAQYRGRKAREAVWERKTGKSIQKYYHLTPKEYQKHKQSYKRSYYQDIERDNRDFRRRHPDYEYEDEYEYEEEDLEQEELDILNEREEYNEPDDVYDLRNVSDIVLINVEDIINNFNPAAFRNSYQRMVGRYKRDYIKSVLEATISSEGREAVAFRLNLANNSTDIADLVTRAIYDSDSIISADSNVNLILFLEILQSSALSPEEMRQLSSDYDE